MAAPFKTIENIEYDVTVSDVGKVLDVTTSGNVETRTRRRYDSTRRAEQAAETRRRIVTAAAECFSSQGYGRTTLAQIAERAGVSVESVTGAGPKRALLIAAFSQTFVGRETEDSVLVDAAWSDALALAEPMAMVEAIAELVLAGQQAGNGIWRAVTAAALEEPEVAEVFAALTERRRADHLRGVQVFADRGLLRSDRSLAEHADVMAVLNGFDCYQTFVVEFGWTPEQLRAWWIDTVCRTVLDPAVVGTPR
jgi:AcrR family transcriptional regulator